MKAQMLLTDMEICQQFWGTNRRVFMIKEYGNVRKRTNKYWQIALQKGVS